MSNTLKLAKQLIAQRSITPDDAGCQAILAERLQSCGFTCRPLPFNKVSNLWATHGAKRPTFVFAGHTDVVPPGELDQWTSPPFEPTLRDGRLYGRGAADMKSSLAAMVTATERFVAEHPNHQGRIAFLITSDEEGQAVDGTARVLNTLMEQKETLDYCLIGEASSEEQVGDTVKVGRRGSLSATLTIHGKQGHIAYPHLADNPIHRCLSALNTLVQHTWDQGQAPFPPTQFQISNVHAGTGATNVIPGNAQIQFNIRYSPAHNADQLKQHVHAVLDQAHLTYTVEWEHGAQPFYSTPGALAHATHQACQSVVHCSPKHSTTGGTSDGRFIAPTGCEVIELGPCRASIHQVDEHISIQALETLHALYYQVLKNILG